MRLAKAEAIYRPNLLINGNFKINQRGQSSYNNTGSSWARKYTVDMWCMLGDNGAVSLTINEDGTVTIVNSSTSECYFAQIFDNLPEDDYTMSANVVSFTGAVKMYPEGSMETAVTVANGINTMTRHGTPNGVSFRLEGNSSVTLKWTKLEQSLFATGYIDEDNAISQIKCRRYVFPINMSLLVRANTTNSFETYFDTFNEFEDTPSIDKSYLNEEGVLYMANNALYIGKDNLQVSVTKNGSLSLLCSVSSTSLTRNDIGTLTFNGYVIATCEP